MNKGTIVLSKKLLNRFALRSNAPTVLFAATVFIAETVFTVLLRQYLQLRQGPTLFIRYKKESSRKIISGTRSWIFPTMLKIIPTIS